MRVALSILVAAIVASAPRVSGEPPGLGGAVPSDALAAARLARTAGDAALHAALEADPAVRRDVLAALRAAPHAQEPVRLVKSLCRWAQSRDPHLAPSAARALFELADRLDPLELAARETPRHTLREARKALADLTEHTPAPRADLVFAARYLDAALGQLLAQLGG